jgi:LmbE family N-acetylglucosaminyl deacetylase
MRADVRVAAALKERPLSIAERGEGRALVVAPHADDEVLGAGGLIALLVERGWRVEVSFATVAGYQSAPRGDCSETASRLQEMTAAAEVLGVAFTEIWPDGNAWHLKLDTVPSSVLIDFVERSVRRLQPDLVIMPCRGHYHQDHRALAQACMAALRPAPPTQRPWVPTVLAYGHTGFAWGGRECSFEPTIFVDVTSVLEKKMCALRCYATQLCEPPHPRSVEGMTSFAATWGACAGVKYAEPFECMRSVIS